MEYNLSERRFENTEVSQNEQDRDEFKKYRLKWISNTVLYSNPNIIFEDENFKNIINMGERAVPFIYEILKERSSYAVHALQYIYGYSLNGGKYTSLDDLCEMWRKELEDKRYVKR